MSGSKSVFGDFLKYVSLNILGQMAYSCYTLADTFFVSASLGTDGLTALNLAFPVFCLMNGTGLMIGMGGATNYAIAKSRGEAAKANQIFTNAVYMVICLAVLYVAAGLFWSDRLVTLLGADSRLFSPTNTYLKVMLLFAPAFLTNTLLQCFVRNDGQPSLSMAAMIIGSISNILLDYLFIFPLRLGILGAILATGLSPLISIGILSPYFVKKKNGFHFLKSAPNIQKVPVIIASGIPPFITELSSGIVMFLFNFIILKLEGNTGVAAFGVISVISLVVTAIYTGLSQGIQPLLSIHHGTGNKRGLRSTRKYALITELLLSCIIYTVIFFGAPLFVSVFNSENNETLQMLAVTGLKLYFFACPFIGFNIVTATYFASTEHTRPAQALSLLRGLFVLVPLAFLLSALWKMTGVWLAYPATEGLVAVMGAGLLILIEKFQRVSE